MTLQRPNWSLPAGLPWVENDTLAMVGLDYRPASVPWKHPRDGYAIRAPGSDEADWHIEATFLSSDKRAVIRFRFESVSAFRVMDENGYSQLWAHPERKRVGVTTFKVRGHLWQQESELAWLRSDGFSHIITTDDDCLEVIARSDPVVEEMGPAETLPADSG